MPDRPGPLCPPELPADPGAQDLDRLWQALAPGAPVDTPGVPGSPAGAPVLRAVMVTSLDGRAVVDGVSAPLGTPTDGLVFTGMRARADLVLVGARTVLAEDYGPAEVDPRWRELRARTAPPLVLVLARAVTPELARHLTRRGPDGFAVGLTDPRADPAAVPDGVPVVQLGDDPATWTGRISDRFDAHEIACEGGPALLGSLLRAGAVDEVVLSICPSAFPDGPDGGISSPGIEPEEIRPDGPAAGASRETRTLRRDFRVAVAFTSPDGGLYTRWVAVR